jgi:hypothetical protein
VRRRSALVLFALLASIVAISSKDVDSSPVAVRFIEGTSHGLLVLRTSSGQLLAGGELLQSVHTGRVTSRLVFHFTDHSLYDDTTVFTQKDQFRLVSDHVVKTGPAFKEASDVFVDAVKQLVTIRRGNDPAKTSHVELPEDISNGLLMVLLKNVARDKVTRVSLVGATDKPRVVQLAIQPVGSETFHVAGLAKKAMHFALKTEIGGVTGLLARVTGKVPPDLHLWIAADDPPTFVKFEGPLALDTPVWRIELAAIVAFFATMRRRPN